MSNNAHKWGFWGKVLGFLGVILTVGGGIVVALINAGVLTSPFGEPIATPTTKPAGILVLEGKKDRVPKTGTTLDVIVQPGTVHLITGGRICVGDDQVTCVGGEPDRSSVVILLPMDNGNITYHLSELSTGNNRDSTFKGQPTAWEQVVDDAVKDALTEPRCADGPCEAVDVLIMGPNGIPHVEERTI